MRRYSSGFFSNSKFIKFFVLLSALSLLTKTLATANEPATNTSATVDAELKTGGANNQLILERKHSPEELKERFSNISQQIKDALPNETMQQPGTEYMKKDIEKLSRPLPVQPPRPIVFPFPSGVGISAPPNYYPHY